MPRGNQTEQGSGKESVRGWSHIQGEVATAILTKQKFEQRPQACEGQNPPGMGQCWRGKQAHPGERNSMALKRASLACWRGSRQSH